jgi:hypothetical protein
MLVDDSAVVVATCRVLATFARDTSAISILMGAKAFRTSFMEVCMYV